jgi:hypothetical protein
MLSFDLLIDREIIKFPLIDGILINQENSHQTWILEIYMPSHYRELFNDFIVSGQLLEARAVISLPDNEPAPFSVVVHSLTEIDDKISVLLKGRLKAQRKKYAEQLLSNLLEDGLRNDELLEAFEKGMRERPSLQERNEKLENLQGDKLV